MRVVIIDDEEVICRGLERAVQSISMDWSVVGVYFDSEEALANCDWDKVDVLITDINMPEMNGLVLVENLRERGYNTAVIIISGYAEFEYAQEAIRNNAVEFILKPIAIDKLIASLQKAREYCENNERHKKNEQFLKENLYSLRKQYFYDILFETRSLSFEEHQHSQKTFSLQGMHYVLRSFYLSDHCMENSSLKWPSKENEGLLLYFIGNGFYSVLNLFESGKEIDEDFQTQYQSQFPEIVWSQAAHVEKVGDLARAQNQLLFELKYCMADSTPTIKNDRPNNMAAINTGTGCSIPVKIAVEYIQSNYSKPLSLANISTEVFIHPTYLSNVFKKQMGYTVVDFINRYRVEMAKQLLSDASNKIYWVAEQTGFVNQRYFSQVFKKVTGVTPLQYKTELLFSIEQK